KNRRGDVLHFCFGQARHRSAGSDSKTRRSGSAMINAVTRITNGTTDVQEQYIKEIDSRYEIAPSVTVHTTARPRVQGKFVFIGDEKFYIKGVTYGSFKPDSQGVDYPSSSIVRTDLALLSSKGVNCVRSYTLPRLWRLDMAEA